MYETRCKKHKWHATFQSIYKFGREERVQLAYEIILPSEEIKLKGESDVQSKAGSNRPLRQSIK